MATAEAAVSEKKVAAGGEQRPCLFLSHSGVDSENARTLKARILATKAAQDAGLEVWFDKDDLVAGQDWQKQLESALTRATAFAVLVGSKGVVNWVEREVREGLRRATGDGAIPFIPVLARDSAGVRALPPFAQQHQCVGDAVNDHTELEKLIAAALKIGPSEPVILDYPFVGLQAMEEKDAHRFFGRDKELDQLAEKLQRHRLVAIVADSGTGKSSLALAGLVPQFRGGTLEDSSGREPDERIRHVVVMRPGDDPMKGLRDGVTDAAQRLGRSVDEQASLRSRLDFTRPDEIPYALRCGLENSKTETLLVVDQFEELLTQAPEAKRGPFIDMLLGLAADSGRNGFRIVLTIRSDYFNLCRPFEELYRRLGGAASAEDSAMMRLKRISDEGLVRAVREPLRLSGYRNDGDAARLAERVRNDLSHRDGDLALAQMALFVVWERHKRSGGSLIEAYVDAGGVSGALANEARRVREKRLTPRQSELLLPLFARLVRPGDTGGAVRRAAGLGEFDPERKALAEALCSDACGRLLIAGDRSFEVGHEALITQWDWLQAHLHAARDDLRLLDGLIRKAEDWTTAASPDKPGHLATGFERETFAGLAKRRDDWLSSAEREFIAACNQAHIREQRLRKWALGGAIAASLLLVAFAGVAAWQAIEANEAAGRAKLNEAIGLTALSQVALSENLPAEAVKLALAAWPRSGDAERPALKRTLATVSGALKFSHQRLLLAGHLSDVRSASFSPDGARIVTASTDKTARIWDAASGVELLSLEDHGGWVTSAAFSPDGKRVVTSSFDRVVRLWDAASGSLLSRLEGPGGMVWSAAFSPDGTLIVTASSDNTVRLWEAASGNLLIELDGKSRDEVRFAAFSPDGTRIVTASEDRTARIWDAASGTLWQTLEGHDGWVRSVEFSPDGARIVSASSDKTARIWDVTSGTVLQTLEGHSGAVWSAAFSPDGSRIVTASEDGTARIWDATSGALWRTLEGHGGWVISADFSPDGARVVTTSEDDTARLWDTASGKLLHPLQGHGDIVWSAAFSPDGGRVVTAADKTARTWDATSGVELLSLEDHGVSVTSATFSPDGGRIVTSSSDNMVRLWDAASGALLRRLEVQGDTLLAAAFSPDGRRIVTISPDNTVRIWEAASGKVLHSFKGHGGRMRSAAFSPDGGRIVTASYDNTVRLWDAVSGALSLSIVYKDAVRSAEFSPDGARIVTASHDRTSRIWDVSSGTLLQTLEGHSGAVSSAAFSPDGSRIVTASDDMTAGIWDATTGALLLKIEGHGRRLTSADFSPDGRRIVTSSNDGTARIWDISSVEKGDGFQVACQRLGNNTSLEQVRQRYGLDELTPICGVNAPMPIEGAELQ